MKTADDTRLSVVVRGRVQGVFYRASAAAEARSLGLTGFVRNCYDGAVELVAEGRRDRLEQLLAWARYGPSGARVDDVAVDWSGAQHEFTAFSIR